MDTCDRCGREVEEAYGFENRHGDPRGLCWGCWNIENEHLKAQRELTEALRGNHRPRIELMDGAA